jgi:hypothetical protein
MIKLLLILTIFNSALFGEVDKIELTSSSHSRDIPANLNEITIIWEKPILSDNDQLSYYIWSIDKNSSSNLEESSDYKTLSSSTTSISISLEENGDFYFHILPILESGDVGVDSTFGKIVVDKIAPTTLFSENLLEDGSIEISLLSEDNSAKIYYTLDGETPDENSILYTKPFKIYSKRVLSATSIDRAGNVGEIVEQNLNPTYFGNIAEILNISDGEKFATNSLNGATKIVEFLIIGDGIDAFQYRLNLDRYGDFSTNLQIDLRDLTDGDYRLFVKGRDNLGNIQEEPTVINFTIDNSSPKNIIAKVENVELSESNIFNSTITISLESDEVSEIRYTLDGDEPSRYFGNIYSNGIEVFKNSSLKVVAIDEVGNLSDQFEFNLTFDKIKPEIPSIFDINGVELNSTHPSFYEEKFLYQNSQKFSFLSNDNLGDLPAIKWSLVGSNPPSLTNGNSGNVTISESSTLQFLAIDKAENLSEMRLIDFLIDQNPPSLTQKDTLQSCSFENDIYVCPNSEINLSFSAFDSETPNTLSILYTQNGSIPTTSSTLFPSNGNLQISLSGNEKIYKFVAIDKVGNRSSVKTLKLKYDLESLEEITEINTSLSLSNGTFVNGETLEIGVAVANGGDLAVYFYSLDGEDYTLQSNISNGVDISHLGDGEHSLSVYATNGEVNSTINRITFYIDKTPPPNPEILGTSLFENDTNITLRVDEDNVSIYYSTNGGIPTANSILYTQPFQLFESKIVKAIAIDKVGNMSSVVEKEFVKDISTVINPPPSETNTTLETNTSIIDNNSSETNTTQPEDQNDTEENEEEIVDNNDSNIVLIEDIVDGEKLTFEDSNGVSKSLSVIFKDLDIFPIDLADGGRYYQFSSESGVSQKVSISVNGDIVASIKNPNIVDINSTIGSGKIYIEDGTISFGSNEFISTSGNRNQIETKVTLSKIEISTYLNGIKTSFPILNLEGENSSIKLYRLKDNSLEFEAKVPLSGTLKF